MKLSFRNNWSLVAMVIITIAFFFNVKDYKPWDAEKNSMVISWDVTGYYYYLPAYLLHGDPGVEGDFGGIMPIWFQGPQGSPGKPAISKYTMGMAYLYAPFFLAAHAYVGLLGGYGHNAFSPPYHHAILIGGYLYFFLGLFYLRKILLHFFDDKTAFVVLLLYAFGTNWMINAIWKPGMAHHWVFTLLTIAIWQLIRFKADRKKHRIALYTILCGVVTLIRITDVFIVLSITGFYLQSNWKWIREQNLLKSILTMGGLFFILPFIPQFIHWYLVSGSPIVYSYNKETFYWWQPMILEGLFSANKGWFVYSPAMLLILPGFYFLYKQTKLGFHWLIWPLLISIYIMFSWWCWWYGGSYGMRPMVDRLPILVFPVALVVQRMFEWKNWARITFALLCVSMFYYNMSLGNYYMLRVLHSEKMTFEAIENLLKYGDGMEYRKALKSIEMRCPNPEEPCSF